MPETWIEDQDKAREVAYASKDERCIAVGAKMLDAVLEPYIDAEEPRTVVQNAAIAEEVFRLYKIYPELFAQVTSSRKAFDEQAAYDALPKIFKHGGLPITETNVSSYRRSIEDIEAAAEVREQVAAALFDTPPSEAFLKEHGIDTYKFRQDGVKEVVALLNGVRHFKARADQYAKNAKRRLERYNEPDADQPNLKKIISMLESTYGELETHLDNSLFKESVFAMQNMGETSLGLLEDMWQEGERIVIAGYRDKAEQHQQTFDAIVSGAAAVDTSAAVVVT
jgi:hypothetical protein